MKNLNIIKNRHNPLDCRFQFTSTENLKLNEYPKHRSGHPRNVWWHFAIQGIWTWIGKLPTDPLHPRHNRYTRFNPESTLHQDEIKNHADNWTKDQILANFIYSIVPPTHIIDPNPTTAFIGPIYTPPPATITPTLPPQNSISPTNPALDKNNHLSTNNQHKTKDQIKKENTKFITREFKLAKHINFNNKNWMLQRKLNTE